MELMFEIISRHKYSDGLRPRCVFSEVGGYIGRSEESDWMLPDRAKRVSRKHILISCDGRDFYLEDLSSNGVLDLLTKELVGKNGRHKIRHSDSFQVGEYAIQARLLMDPETYVPPDMGASADIIPDEAFLDLDPLKALDQEDELAAKHRMGFYDGILETSAAPARPMRDHSESRLDALGSLKVKQDELLPPRKPKGQSEIAVPKTLGASGDPLAAIENSIEFLRETMARMGENLKALEAARDFLKTGEKAGLPDADKASPAPTIPEDDKAAPAPVIPDDFNTGPAPIIPEDFDLNALF